MALQLYDTGSRSKREFAPRSAHRVTLYVCGPTVYDHIHIGNARPVVVFDVLFRVLKQQYPDRDVLYGRNITDVDDKINAKAMAEAIDIRTLTDRYAQFYIEQMAALGNLPPSFMPRATDHIPAMVGQISALVANGHAYSAEGHVLFDTQSYADYGRLSGRDMDEMIAGARVDVAPYKRHPTDFVLWKPAAIGAPGWDSPWGRGRPGWHIECSAMIEAVFGGGPIDIHGGGIDLVFPHHENERAQSCCAQGMEDLANFWMHNGFLDFSGEKMSKSLGNVVRPLDLLQIWDGEVLRYALLSAHYRQPLDWTQGLTTQSKAALDRLYGVLQDADRQIGPRGDTSIDDEIRPVGVQAQSVLERLLDDLNTPGAIGQLFGLGDALREDLKRESIPEARAKREAMLQAGRLLGLLQQSPTAWFSGRADATLKAQVEALLTARVEARKAKDFSRADAIRGELDHLGVVVMDSPTGATWRMK